MVGTIPHVLVENVGHLANVDISRVFSVENLDDIENVAISDSVTEDALADLEEALVGDPPLLKEIVSLEQCAEIGHVPILDFGAHLLNDLLRMHEVSLGGDERLIFGLLPIFKHTYMCIVKGVNKVDRRYLPVQVLVKSVHDRYKLGRGVQPHISYLAQLVQIDELNSLVFNFVI